MADLDDFHWWQRAVLYQVYVRSFFDFNGDGVGDLPGVAAKLDYFSWLGINALWISPIYPSPMADFGYDIADYFNVDASAGTLADFDDLLAEVHRRDMKLLMDFVPNHTSSRHPWFVDARRDRQSAHRDWYLWHDPAPGGRPPNNWISLQGGPAWTFDEATEQYYLHTYLPEQPDLNWRNPEVRLAMLDVMRFWLDRGVDGFRIDAVAHLIKDRRWRDNPPNPDFKSGDAPNSRQLACYLRDQPEVHEVIAWLRRLVDLYGDRILIGETYLSPGRLVSYYGAQGLNFPFNFKLTETNWTPERIRAAVDSYEAVLAPDDWPNWVLGNHDRPRVSARLGDDRLRLAAMLLLTLRGTPTMYYGDEIGMLSAEISSDEVLDPRGKSMPGFGRDPERAPMQWSAGHAAGFTSGNPWLPVAPGYECRNVDREQKDRCSLLHLYRNLLALRAREPALQVGDYAPVLLREELVSYQREFAPSRFLIVLNFSGQHVESPIPRQFAGGQVRLSTEESAMEHAIRLQNQSLHLLPWEGQIISAQ